MAPRLPGQPVDIHTHRVHTRTVAALRNRLTVPDARGAGAFLRVSKHPDHGKVVLSHWRGTLCVASTPVELAEVPALINVLAEALGEGLAVDSDRSVDPRPVGSRRPHLATRLRLTAADRVELLAARWKRRD